MTEPAALSPIPLVRTRLSVMMFLQYAIWGAWLPILYPFLLGHRGLSLDQVGMILAGGAAGAIIGPFIAGQVADRHFATEKFLAISHLLGAVLVWILATTPTFNGFLALSILYGIIYAPTLALTNSISFANLPDRDRDFGKVRVWGTAGWIVAGIAVGQWLLRSASPADQLEAVRAARTALETLQSAPTPDTTALDGAQSAIKAATDTLEASQNAGRADAFRLSAMLGIVMGFYCLTLPHTPPTKNAKDTNAVREAVREIRRQPLVMLFLLAVPISVIHQFYFVHTSQFLTGIQNAAGGSRLSDSINAIFGVGGGGLMTVGQMVELVVLASIPLFAKRVGRKTLLGIGIAAYAVRMALFAYLQPLSANLGIPELVIVIAGVSLHGLCFGCFIFVAFMIVDEETTHDIRATAQNLFNLVIVGIGIIVGSWFATSIVGNWATTSITDAAGVTIEQMDYSRLFSIPMWMAVACFVMLAIFYPNRRTGMPVPSEPSPPAPELQASASTTGDPDTKL